MLDLSVEAPKTLMYLQEDFLKEASTSNRYHYYQFHFYCQFIFC